MKYAMQKEEIAQAALKLKETLHVARTNFIKEGYPISAKSIDDAFELLNPILDLCTTKTLEEPFDFFGYMLRNMGDDFWISNTDQDWRRLCDLGRGGLTHEEFFETDFFKNKLMPKQLRFPL